MGSDLAIAVGCHGVLLDSLSYCQHTCMFSWSTSCMDIDRDSDP